MLKRTVAIAVAVMFLAVSLAVASEAKDQLKTSIDKIISILKDEKLKAPEKLLERREMIFQAVEERFDFEEMGKRALSRHYKKRTPEELKSFHHTFSRLLENSYISKIEAYTDEEVKFLDDRAKGPYYYVYTEIISKGKAIPVNYSLRKIDGSWMVYDVNIEGVSLVRNYMTQFNKIIKKNKFSGLMEKLNRKLESLDEELKAKSKG